MPWTTTASDAPRAPAQADRAPPTSNSDCAHAEGLGGGGSSLAARRNAPALASSSGTWTAYVTFSRSQWGKNTPDNTTSGFDADTCQDGNCKCVKVKAKGEHCGDGTRRGPDFSNMECQTGKCAYNCDLCLNCDGGNCVCVVDESVHGT